jgi:hypothetical protein
LAVVGVDVTVIPAFENPDELGHLDSSSTWSRNDRCRASVTID